jgi:predicted short-subunit dehydrogenase-like oxidoreductase (DUF2520 family)
VTVAGDLLRRPLVVGPGRLGRAFADLLLATGLTGTVALAGRGDRTSTDGDRFTYYRLPALPADPTLILLTVPDAAIAEVAELLARADLPPVPVLHTSGALSSAALGALSRRGHPVGSIHPLAAVPHAPAAAERLSVATFGVEGDGEGADAALAVARALKARTIRVDPSGKPAYHAAAVFASNYVVTLLGLAERLMVGAGIPEKLARETLVGLAAGAVENVGRYGPAEALTGPIARGDDLTIAIHLRGLSAPERKLYSALARAALPLARVGGLDGEGAARIERVLEGEA